MAQVAKMSRANVVHLNENLIFNFMKLTLNVSESETCSVNIGQILSEHLPIWTQTTECGGALIDILYKKKLYK